jgi:hypothetical protein
MNEGIQEYVAFANLVFILMTAIYSLVFQLILLFSNSLIAIGMSTTAWLVLTYTLITRRGPWALIYAKVHRALTGVHVLGITNIERSLLMPYVINYAVYLILSIPAEYPLFNLVLRLISIMPLLIMIIEFAVLPRLLINNNVKTPDQWN